MHLMRVLEVGLRALATRFEVEFGSQNWQNLIDQIEAQIRRISTDTAGETGRKMRNSTQKLQSTSGF
jgi:hypothetical protein